VLLGAGLALAIVALRLPGGQAHYLGALGAALLIAFPFVEKRTAAPVIDLKLFKSATFTAGGTIVALQNMAMYPLLFQLPIFFDKVRGLGARSMGQALLALTVAMMAGSIAGGRLSELIGVRVQVLLASLMALCGLWWVHDLAQVMTPREVVPGLILIGAGIGLTSPPSQAAAMSSAPREHAGMAGGVLASMRYLGGVAGTAALGALLIEPGGAEFHRAPIVVYAAALIASAALSLLLPKRAGNAHDS
jgi:predicted MFS family arabinose efflux permease